MRFPSVPENRRRLVWSTAVAVVVLLAAGLGLVLTSGDTDSATAATQASTVRPTTTATDTATTIARASTTTNPTSPTTTSTTTADLELEVTAAPAATTTTMPGATLTAGSPPADVTELQRQLNLVTGSSLQLDGLYGTGTETAVRNFQAVIGVPTTGVADPVTRWMLAEAANRAGVPTIGAGGSNGCQVAVVGDSLIAGAEDVHTSALGRVGCAAAVDGKGGRTLSYGWQCRVDRDGRWQVLLFEDRIPGNATCGPSGLTLLASWADADALGDVVVVALGTNDSGRYESTRWQQTWVEAIRLAGGRPVVFVTPQARPGSAPRARQNIYADALRQWCSDQRSCVLAEWANTAAAADPASYIDALHLTVAGTRARAAFIADVVAALLTGVPIPNPQPPPTPVIPPAGTTTTVETPPATTTTTTPPSGPTTPPTTTPPATTSSTSTTAPAPTTPTTTVAATTTTTVSPTTTATASPGPPDGG